VVERRELGRGESPPQRIRTIPKASEEAKAPERNAKVSKVFGISGFALLALLGLGTIALAQTPADPRAPAPAIVPLLDNVTRVEGWSFFEPSIDGGDPDYTIVGNRATLGGRVNTRRVTLEGSFRYAQLVGLPRQAIGPGPLGPGALYFAAARNSKAFQLYFKSMSLKLKDVVPGLTAEGGRMAYESGHETPFAGRLIGRAEWTIFERAFDGIRVDYDRRVWRAHAAFVMPTQGAFEESGNPTLTPVRIASADWTTHALQLFAHSYRDTRAVRSRPDNTGGLVNRADIDVQTFGASFAPAFGRADIRAWGAVQRGRWYDDSHSAFSASIDGAYRFAAAGRPAVSAGLLYSSGDDDGADQAHRTFFPMVPTTTPEALGGTYAQMNLRDAHAALTFRAREGLTISGAVHRLSLVTPFDRWYSGTGATSLHGEYFGYSTRPSRLATGLGTYVQASAEAAIRRYWALKTSVGVVKGGDVVRRQFAGNALVVVIVENRLTLGN
jgi:hypothetical protein